MNEPGIVYEAPNIYDFFLSHIWFHQITQPYQQRITPEQMIFCARSLEKYAQNGRHIGGIKIAYLSDLLDRDLIDYLTEHPVEQAEAASLILTTTGFVVSAKEPSEYTKKRSKAFDAVGSSMFWRSAHSLRNSGSTADLLGSIAQNYSRVKSALNDASRSLSNEARETYVERLIIPS